MQQTETTVIRFPTLKKKIGVSRSTIDRWEKSSLFPQRILLGKNSVGWNLLSVEQWLVERSGNMKQENRK